jgi:hypothetical protein
MNSSAVGSFEVAFLLAMLTLEKYFRDQGTKMNVSGAPIFDVNRPKEITEEQQQILV